MFPAAQSFPENPLEDSNRTINRILYGSPSSLVSTGAIVFIQFPEESTPDSGGWKKAAWRKWQGLAEGLWRRSVG